jgi:hypothetical protein
MTDNAQNAYAKGYAAGRRKKQKLAEIDRIEAQRRTFRDRAFLTVLPWVFQQNTWGITTNGKHTPYSTVDERVKLAWNIANSATDQRP